MCRRLARAALPRLAAACLCLFWRAHGARPALGLDGLARQQEEPVPTKKRTWDTLCSTCSEDLSFDRTFGLEWVVFPPSPFPNPITTLICTPDPSAERWLPAVSTDTDASTLCGGPDMLEAMSAEDKEKCVKAAEYMQKGERSKHNYVVDVWAKQMWRCGSCAICGIWKNLKSLWDSVKKMASHMVSRFRHKLFAHAPEQEVWDMGKRIKVLLAASGKMLQTPKKAESLLQKEGASDNLTAELLDALPPIADSRLKHQLQTFQGEMIKHWSGMEKEARERHMSLLEKSLANMTSNEDELLYQEAEKIHQKLKSKANGIPEVLKQPECEEALKGAAMQRTLEISVNIEYPNLANFITALLLPIPMPETALKSLIPEVLVMAIPRSVDALQKEIMHDCVDLLSEAQEKFMQTCSSVENFMACTSTISQRVFYNLVYQQWWPVGAGHDTENGKPRTAIETMVNAFKGSCLENEMLNDQQGDEKDIMNSNPDANWLKFERFEQMACPYVRNLVDGADGGDGLPEVSDKVWVASVRGFGASVSRLKLRQLHGFRNGKDARQCPEVMPFAAAYCADQLSCISDPDVAGKQLGMKGADFENRIAEVMSRVDANHDGVLDEDESARAWGVLEDHLKTRQQTPLTPGHGNEEEHDAMVRAGLWNLMWRSVNATFGGPGGWKTMTAAMAGERTMDWGGALRNWRRVYDFMLRELTHAENKYLANMSSRRVLHEVLHDLSAGYTSTICKPGGLVDFQARELRVLGVEGAEIDAFLASREAGIRKRADMTPGAGWRRLLITSKNKATRKSFQKEVEASSCHCMCYQKGERWTYGTHMSAADKPTCTRVENVPPGTGSISDIPEFAVDGILMKAPGNKTWQNLGKAFLKLIPATGGSSCRMMLEWELSGEKGGGIGYISKCEAPKPLRTSYWSTPSHTFEIVVYNLALDDPHEDASGHLVDTVQAHRASKKLLANRRLQNKWNTNLSLTTMEKMH